MGIFAGFEFSDPQDNGPIKIRTKNWRIFRKSLFVTRNESFVPTSFCRRAEGQGRFAMFRRSYGATPALMTPSFTPHSPRPDFDPLCDPISTWIWRTLGASWGQNCVKFRSKSGQKPFFTQISGRNFLPDFCGEVHPETAPLQALYCALCSKEQSTFRGGERGEKVPRKGEEEGRPAEGAKSKKGRVKTGQPKESFEAIFGLRGYLNFLRLFLETLPEYPWKQA